MLSIFIHLVIMSTNIYWSPTLCIQLLLGTTKKYPTFLFYFPHCFIYDIGSSYIPSIVFIFFTISFYPTRVQALNQRLYQVLPAFRPWVELCYGFNCVHPPHPHTTLFPPLPSPLPLQSKVLIPSTSESILLYQDDQVKKKMRSLGWALIQLTRVLLKMENLDKGKMKWGYADKAIHCQRIQVRYLQAKECQWLPEARMRQRKIPPTGFKQSMNLPIPWFQTSTFQNFETKTFLLF